MRKGMSGVSFNFIPCAELEIPSGMYTPHSQAAPGIMRTKLVWNWRYKRGRIPPQCAPPLKLGRELEFWVFGGSQNILDFRGVALWKREGYFFGGGQFILRPFSHFEMQGFKNWKIQYSHFQIWDTCKVSNR